jgi:Mn2+/Fe2+ NRAMP family transporter
VSQNRRAAEEIMRRTGQMGVPVITDAQEADLGAIGAARNLLVPGVPTPVFVAPIGVLIVALQLFGPYRLIARVFKWLTLALLSYIGVAFFMQPNWSAVLRGRLVPTLSSTATI